MNNEERMTDAAEWAESFDHEAFMVNVFNKRFAEMSSECWSSEEHVILGKLSSLFSQ